VELPVLSTVRLRWMNPSRARARILWCPTLCPFMQDYVEAAPMSDSTKEAWANTACSAPMMSLFGR
jgi:hypothetical protein